MSHSSGYGVQVSAAELGRRRAVAGSQGLCAELRRRALDAAKAAVSAGAGYIEVPEEPRIATGESAASATAAAARYQQRIERVVEQISSARTQAVLQAFDERAPSSIGGTISIAWKHRAGRSETGAPGAAATARKAEDSTVRAREMIASLAELEDASRRGTLVTEITATIGTPDAAGRLDRIFSEIDRAYRDQAREEGIRNEAGEVLATMRMYSTPATHRAREVLVAATTREALKAGVELARLAREEAEAREQEDFVVEQTAEVLRELGYDVGPSFVETAELGDFAVVTNDQLGEYGLQLRVVDHGKRLLTNTVALDAETTHAEDVAAEEHVCSDLAIIAERLGKRGVRLDRYFESKPGEMAIERRLDVGAARPKSANRRTRRSTGSLEARS